MKFRVKIMLCMLGMLSVLFSIGGSLLISSSFQSMLKREQDSAYHTYQMVLGTLQIINNLNPQYDYQEISSILEQLSKQNMDSWTALRLYSQDAVIYEYGNFQFPKADQPTDAGKCRIRYLPREQNSHFMILSGILAAGGDTLFLEIAHNITPLYLMRQTQENTYQIIFLFMSVLCALLSYSISRVLTSPLTALSKVSCAIAKGDLSSRAKIRTHDEIGLVSRDFNDMASVLEQNIMELKESMERQERFMGSFAHELKTPMTSIIGYADLIREQALSPDEQTEAAHYIVKEGKRLENLSQKLLNILLLKNTEIKFIKTRPADLIYGLAAHMEPVYSKYHITLQNDCEDGACMMEPDLIKALFINLWDNARKAMDEQGGCLYTRSEMLPDGCRVWIRDTGCGIPPESLEHLTEAFYRVDKSRSREQGGVGLGLSLCKEIVFLHNGSIQFESQVGKGTTVAIELRGGTA